MSSMARVYALGLVLFWVRRTGFRTGGGWGSIEHESRGQLHQDEISMGADTVFLASITTARGDGNDKWASSTPCAFCKFCSRFVDMSYRYLHTHVVRLPPPAPLFFIELGVRHTVDRLLCPATFPTDPLLPLLSFFADVFIQGPRRAE